MIDIDCYEIAANMWTAAFDMDLIGEEQEIIDSTKKDLEEALYQLKVIAQNKYNSDYWRTFVSTLDRIFSE